MQESPDDSRLQGDPSMDPLSRAVRRKEKRNRSGNQFTVVLRKMAESAANRIETITLFEEVFPMCNIVKPYCTRDAGMWNVTMYKIITGTLRLIVI